MAKRRTRKQKQEARHTYKVTWSPQSSGNKFEAKKVSIEPSVKRQIKKDQHAGIIANVKTKSTEFSEQYSDIASIKKDIAKSLILAGFILASEVMLYLIWQ